MKFIICTLLLTLILANCESQELLPFRVDKLWGYKNKQGDVKIEPQYQYATKFVNNSAIVAKNGKLGAIDKNNITIIPFNYEYLRSLDTADYLFGYRAKYFGEYIKGVMSKDEIVKIPAEYSYISKHKNTYIVTRIKDSIIGKSSFGDVRSRTNVSGLLDINGNIIIPCKYYHIRWATDSNLVVDSSFTTNDGKYLSTHSALFSENGKKLTGFDYKVFGNFIEGIAKARIGDKFGFIYPTGKIAIPITFDYCEEFNAGYAIIKQQDKWGAIDKKGKLIIDAKFEYQEVKAMLAKKSGN